MLTVHEDFQCDNHENQKLCGFGLERRSFKVIHSKDYIIINEDCRLFDPKTDECTEDVLAALMYSYIFYMEDTLVIVGNEPNSTVIILNERRYKHRRPTLLPPTLSKKPTQDVINKAYEKVKEGIGKMNDDYDDISYSERSEFIGILTDVMDNEKIPRTLDACLHGTCCICKGDCNILSQICGHCARKRMFCSYPYTGDTDDDVPTGDTDPLLDNLSDAE